MDGRDFVNMPTLGLTGLSLETGRVSSGHNGGHLMPSTGQLPPFCTAKYYPSPLGLYSQSGLPHLSRSVYHSFIPMSHLEPTGGVTPLLPRMGQHSMIDPQKDGFCLVGQQSTYHPQTSVLKTSANQTQNTRENDPVCHLLKNANETSKDSKEKVFRSEIFLTPSSQSTAKKDRRFSEETQSSDLSDRELDYKAEKERKKMTLHRLPKQGEHSLLSSEFAPNRWSGNIETKSKHLQMSFLSNYEGESVSKPIISAETKFIKQPSRHDENLRPLCQVLNQSKSRVSLITPDKKLSPQCMCQSSHPANVFCKVASTTPAQPVSSSMYSIIQQAKEPTNDIKTLASNVSVIDAASDEHGSCVHTGIQAGNPNGKELRNPEEKAQILHSPFFQESLVNNTKRPDREKGTLSCCNFSLKGQAVSEPFSKNYNHVSVEKKILDSNVDHLHCAQENVTSSQQDAGNVIVKHSEEKAKQFKTSNITNLQMPSFATQHSQISTGKEDLTKLCIESKTLGSRKTNVQFTDPSGHCEHSAMQNLISYSGSFEKETAAWQCIGRKSPFGGLGNVKLDETQLKNVKVHNLSQKEVKKDPDRPDNTKDKARDSLSFQGEVEVRNPPVGIAVAVARQKDNGGNKMHSSKGKMCKSEHCKQVVFNTEMKFTPHTV